MPNGLPGSNITDRLGGGFDLGGDVIRGDVMRGEAVPYLDGGHRPVPQNGNAARGMIHLGHRALHAHRTPLLLLTLTIHQRINNPHILPPQIIIHVLGRSGTHVSKPIGAGGGNRNPTLSNQRPRDGVARRSAGDVPRTGHYYGWDGRERKGDYREGSRPEGGSQGSQHLLRRIRRIFRVGGGSGGIPELEGVGHIQHVDNERIGEGTAFSGEDFANGRFGEGVGTQTVHSLRREGYQ
mmetsp:Transcript_50939/g.51327  ORF Transcript_50939/g.51327 Transcript_50939/m.51327 type:complete len:238 (-) Transcript_50939:219-932(-)